MKKLLWLILFLSVFASADVRIPGAANYQVIGRNLTWASGVNQNFIMDVVSPSSGMCLQIRNKDTASHAYTVAPVLTSDLSTTTFTGNTGSWTAATISPTGANTTAASSTDNFFINTTGAAHVTISISGGSGTGTADITVSQTSNQCGTGGNVLASGCGKSVSVIVATGANAIVIPTPSAGLFIHVCAYSLSGQATSTGTLIFANGTSGACTVLGTFLWQFVATTGNPSSGLAVPSPSQIFQTTVAAQPLCGSNNPGTGANAIFNVSYTIF